VVGGVIGSPPIDCVDIESSVIVDIADGASPEYDLELCSAKAAARLDGEEGCCCTAEC
jgi:hypothetical protein